MNDDQNSVTFRQGPVATADTKLQGESRWRWTHSAQYVLASQSLVGKPFVIVRAAYLFLYKRTYENCKGANKRVNFYCHVDLSLRKQNLYDKLELWAEHLKFCLSRIIHLNRHLASKLIVNRLTPYNTLEVETNIPYHYLTTRARCSYPGYRCCCDAFLCIYIITLILQNNQEEASNNYNYKPKLETIVVKKKERNTIILYDNIFR